MLRKRKILFFIALLAVCVIPALAQYLKPGQEGRALVLYKKDAQGIYHKNVAITGEMPHEEDIVEVICLDKKHKYLYVVTEEGIYELALDKKHFNDLKKDKSIRQLKNDEVWEAITRYSNQLDKEINYCNIQRNKEIADSTTRAELHLEMIRKAREKAIADSIACVEEQRKREQEFAEYRHTHSPYIVPNPGKSMGWRGIRDIYSEAKIEGDSILIASITDGKVAIKKYPELYNGYKGVDFGFVLSLEDCLKDPTFAYHYEVFADSLVNRLDDLSEDAKYTNGEKIVKNVEAWFNRKFPNGFISDYGWSDDYGIISFNLNYYNTSYNKTIKYLAVDVNFYNAVDDLRCKGTFRGTGPIEPLDGGGWEWDNSLIFTRGDESYCKIKRITITYTNGKKVVLTGDKIKIFEVDDDD